MDVLYKSYLTRSGGSGLCLNKGLCRPCFPSLAKLTKKGRKKKKGKGEGGRTIVSRKNLLVFLLTDMEQ